MNPSIAEGMLPPHDDRSPNELRIAQLEDALRDAYRFVDSHVYIAGGDHENPPEPGDQFSYDAQSFLASIQTVLGQSHGDIVDQLSS